jgi:Predicted membrane protein
MKKVIFPKIGLRMVKSVLAVFICFMIDSLRSGSVPFYSAIAAILCMQPDVHGSKKVAINRTIGTLIGGFYGMLAIMIFKQFNLYSNLYLEYTVVSITILPLIYITVLLKKHKATYITCVVYLSVVISHAGDVSPYLFAMNRIVDTLIGIFVSLGINAIPFLQKKSEEEKELVGQEE